MILDHNITAIVTYNTITPYVTYDKASIKSTVEIDTTGWTSGLNPRLITADSSTYEYWTNDAIFGAFDRAWIVAIGDCLDCNSVCNDSTMGVRTVITIDKSSLS